MRTHPVCLCKFALALVAAWATLVGSRAFADPMPKDVLDAVNLLPTADVAGRQKIYDLLAEKGDARLIPLLNAYRDGQLLFIDGRFIIYGPKVNLPTGGQALPMIDALTAEPVKEPDGKPMYSPKGDKVDLSKALKSPPRMERPKINDLVSTLSLLAPDPETRIASIRDAGERAVRTIVDPEEQKKVTAQLKSLADLLKSRNPTGADEAIAAINAALSEKATSILNAVPSESGVSKIKTALGKVQAGLPAPSTAPTTAPADDLRAALATATTAVGNYGDLLSKQKLALEDVTKTAPALKRQLEKEPNGRYAPALREALASSELVTGDRAAQVRSAEQLGGIGSNRAASLLRRFVDAAKARGDAELEKPGAAAFDRADSYQTKVQIVQNTFAGASAGSILVLLALGLSIVFGLMGVINMAHGEFMMVGAFTTYVVSDAFKHHLSPAAYNWYLLAAIPAAFLVSGFVGFVCEALVIRRLYGRPLETLLATWGIGLIIVFFVRWKFGDTLSVAPPKWMEGGVEVATDLVFPLNRVYIILFCGMCIVATWFVVNRTKLGLILRATTQNREMAAALGVATRRVDGFTFALGAGLAGLAGVAVPLYNKINPNIGQEYIVDSFMVVVVGGVGKLAGAVIAGFGLGFIGKYLEPVFQHVSFLKSGASVIGKVVVLGLIILFLQRKPAGLFPPKGRHADV